jgi:hypothetical protein
MRRHIGHALAWEAQRLGTSRTGNTGPVWIDATHKVVDAIDRDRVAYVKAAKRADADASSRAVKNPRNHAHIAPIHWG